MHAVLCCIGACPQMTAINVHLGISDYFDDTTDEQNQEDYRQIAATLKVS